MSVRCICGCVPRSDVLFSIRKPPIDGVPANAPDVPHVQCRTGEGKAFRAQFDRMALSHVKARKANIHPGVLNSLLERKNSLFQGWMASGRLHNYFDELEYAEIRSFQSSKRNSIKFQWLTRPQMWKHYNAKTPAQKKHIDAIIGRKIKEKLFRGHRESQDPDMCEFKVYVTETEEYELVTTRTTTLSAKLTLNREALHEFYKSGGNFSDLGPYNQILAHLQDAKAAAERKAAAAAPPPSSGRSQERPAAEVVDSDTADEDDDNDSSEAEDSEDSEDSEEEPRSKKGKRGKAKQSKKGKKDKKSKKKEKNRKRNGKKGKKDKKDKAKKKKGKNGKKGKKGKKGKNGKKGKKGKDDSSEDSSDSSDETTEPKTDKEDTPLSLARRLFDRTAKDAGNLGELRFRLHKVRGAKDTVNELLAAETLMQTWCRPITACEQRFMNAAEAHEYSRSPRIQQKAPQDILPSWGALQQK